MKLYVSGVNYKRTPLEIREKLSISTAEMPLILTQLRQLPGVEECVALSTCNRTELYVFSRHEQFDTSQVEEFLCDVKGVDSSLLKKYFYTYIGLQTAEHLFRVSCGLDSQVLGENQILGQIKLAHTCALEAKTSASVLNTLFRQAITVAKKVKTCTGLSRNSLSTGSLAIQNLVNIYQGTLASKSALIIASGKIGKNTLKNMLVKGIGKVYITNRTHGKAAVLALDYPNVYNLPYQDRYSVLDECDIVISCTNSPHYTITSAELSGALKTNKQRTFIDLAVPRDFDTAIKKYPGINFFCLDDLQPVLDKNLQERLGEAKKAGLIIDEYVLDFQRWYNYRKTAAVGGVNPETERVNPETGKNNG